MFFIKSLSLTVFSDLRCQDTSQMEALAFKVSLGLSAFAYMALDQFCQW